MKPKLVRTLAALRRETAKWRKEGLSYAVVPTMGAIHSGHMELVAEGLKRADRVITTIFVNPKQFAANEDLDKYPRDEDGDVLKLGKAGTHLIYVPNPEEIYPEGFCTTITLAGPAKAGLEDKFRPEFFDGVTTVVAKLFIQTGADFAMFGEKTISNSRSSPAWRGTSTFPSRWWAFRRFVRRMGSRSRRAMSTSPSRSASRHWQSIRASAMRLNAFAVASTSSPPQGSPPAR